MTTDLAGLKPDLFRFRHENLSLAYRDGGGIGIPLVFQHGLCADSDQTFSLLPADPRFRRVTLECRGHGSSEIGPEARLSLATFADDLSALIDQRIGGPVILGGTSMGAAVALRLAVLRPDLVRALILVRPAWIVDDAPANLGPYAEIGRLLRFGTTDAARSVFRRKATAAGRVDEVPGSLEPLLSLFDRKPTLATAALLGRIAGDGPGVSSSDLDEIMVPTLVIGQVADVLHPVGHAEVLARMIPRAELQVLPAKTAVESRRMECRGAIGHFLTTVPIPFGAG